MLVAQPGHNPFELLCNEITELSRGAVPHDEIGIATAAIAWAERLIQEGRAVEASNLLRDCLAIQRSAFPQGGWRVADTMSSLGAALVDQEEFEEAEGLLLEAHDLLEADPNAPEDRLGAAAARIAYLYEAWAGPDEATEWTLVRLSRAASP